MLDSIQCEARLVGRRILELMKPDENGRYFSVFDKAKNEYRRVEYRDVVILLRPQGTGRRFLLMNCP